MRITPAGAGKTSLFFTFCIVKKDHPRRCGENLILPPKKPKRTGSPPQVRGKLCLRDKGNRGRGITPAGAGKTFSLTCQLPRLQDHPRRCGENNRSAVDDLGAIGSPPQVRGKQLQYIFRVRSVRITPAGAGKTAVDAAQSPKR